MNEIKKEQNDQIIQEEEAVAPARKDSLIEKGKDILKKFTDLFPNKKIAMICGLAVVILVILVIALTPSKFKKVERECGKIAGQISYGKDYFTIDTYPDEYKNMDSAVKALLQPQTEKKALEAIQYANKELGFSGSLYSQMIKTSALMGRQIEENGKYKVSWTYHPNNGLEVTYSKK